MIITPEQNYIPPDKRIINYLRISITDKCNLACRYCVPKGSLPLLPHDSIARYEEIHKIVGCASELGISKLRITGGEPLVRKGVFPFIRSLSQIEGINEISITTNGVLLEPNIDELIKSGVNRINISLDTLNPAIFRFISGRDQFEKVWRGIMAALDKGVAPIKLNAVILRGINDGEIEELARLSMIYPFHVRFIEYMPMGNSAVDISQQVLIPEIRERIEKQIGKLAPVSGDMKCARELKQEESKGKNGVSRNQGVKGDNKSGANAAGPAKRYRIDGALGEIGFISPVSSHFCHECNRLRLTSTGHLRPCLLNNLEIDLLTPLRQGASNDTIRQIIISAIKSKPAAHTLNDRNGVSSSETSADIKRSNRIDRQMSAIGG